MQRALFAFFLTAILAAGFFFTASISAQETSQVKEEKLEGRVEKIVEEKEIEVMGKQQLYQKLELLVTGGILKDKKITVESGNLPTVSTPNFKVGDEVVISKSADINGNDFFYITDFVRTGSLFWLFLAFSALAIVIGRLRGLTSLIGMGISFVVIFIFILPQILAGKDPVLISILGSFMIIPVTFYLSHGINRKTTSAVLATIITLIATGALASFFVEVSKLSGFASEEAGFLQVARQGAVNIKGLLLAGIIIGVLGILDDITISQASIVEQLKAANKDLNRSQLYKKAMEVGRDHIASMVNTLVLVYTGAAMPLLLLFLNNPQPFSEIINYEIIANEIIRTLVGSIGLMLAVPVASYISVVFVEKS